MAEAEIPDHLSRARGYLRDFAQIIKPYNLTRAQAALCLSILNPGIDHVVFGVDNIGQLAEDVEAAQNIAAAHGHCADKLKEHFRDIEKEIIFPSLWAKR
jgi:aryl-alcohol dehydrogenase-like predicted oxidoreductase